LQFVRRVIRDNISLLRTTIETLSIIARFNTLINNQRYTNLDNLYIIILNVKKIYQDLIKCVILLKQEASKKDLFNASKKVIYNFLNKEKKAQIENNATKISEEKNFYNNNKNNKKEVNALTKVLFVVANSKFETKLKLRFLFILFTFASKKASKDKQDHKIKKNKF